MVLKTKTKDVEFADQVFDIGGEPMPQGAWWWWFWLFFMDNPENPEKPRQLMILWSTKNIDVIDCNDLLIKLRPQGDRSVLDGAVAAWFYDGKKMHHNYLLEQCDLEVSHNNLKSKSKTPTEFSITKNTSKVTVGNELTFNMKHKLRNEFTKPQYNSNNVLGRYGYNMIKLNHQDLKGEYGGEKFTGSAYFQRVFVNSPAIPWYWGIFHFEKGQILSYFNPHISKIPVKKNISFYDGKTLQRFNEMKVFVDEGRLPRFRVRGENRQKKIAYTVEPYSHSSWTFKAKTFRLIPNLLVYNEYPAKITQLQYLDKKTGCITGLDDVGSNVGNAEHTTGFLL